MPHKISFAVVMVLLAADAAVAQFPTGWAYKQKISIDNTKIDATLTDFTVLVTREMLSANGDDAVDPSGAAADTSQTNGGDLRFSSDAAGTTRLACDVISWAHDVSTSSEDAECLVAVKIPSVSSSADTDFYMWYGTSGSDSQPARTDTYGQDNAYDANWEGFWPDAGTTDRTVNALTLTANGSPTVGGATGPTGSTPATDFNGTTQDMRTSSPPMTAPAATMIGWAEPDNLTAGHRVMGLADVSAGDQWLTLICAGSVTGDPVQAHSRATASASSDSGTAYAQNAWNHVGAVFATTTSRTAYLDGVAATANTTTSSPTGIDTLAVASTPDSSPTYFDGAIALAQLHSVARATAWIKADYEQIANPSTFGVTSAPTSTSGTILPILHAIKNQ